MGTTEIHEHEFVAEGLLLTDVRGSLPHRVLSTPGMIAMMEYASTTLAMSHIPPATTTVGFEVCIKHVGAATEGSHLTARAVLREIADERKLRFDVEVVDGDRTIGVGTHERRIVPGAPEPAASKP